MGSHRGSGRLTVSIPSPMRFKKRASRYNACIGGQLKGKKYAKPPVGMGGRRNIAVQSAFISAVNSCKGH